MKHLTYINEYNKYYNAGDVVLIEYWYNDMITPVRILEKIGRSYMVSHNCDASKIQNAPDETIKSSDIIDHYRVKKNKNESIKLYESLESDDLKTLEQITNIAKDEGLTIGLRQSNSGDNWTPRWCSHVLNIGSAKDIGVIKSLEMFQNISDRLDNEGFLIISRITFIEIKSNILIPNRKPTKKLTTCDISPKYPFSYIKSRASSVRSVSYYISIII